jgi:hypothetical protein
MGIAQIATTVSVFLAGFVPASCHKSTPPQKAAITINNVATAAATSTNDMGVVTNTILHDLGEVALTNHYETIVQLGGGKDCILSPKVLDGRNVQITFALETRAQNGKIHGLSVGQVITSSGKSVGIALGDFNLTLTPLIALE